jgi:hypothetical protein
MDDLPVPLPSKLNPIQIEFFRAKKQLGTYAAVRETFRFTLKNNTELCYFKSNGTISTALSTTHTTNGSILIGPSAFMWHQNAPSPRRLCA